jgi:predicted kinase
VPAETPIVVVTGPPASGKSTVARALAEGLRLPLIAKDPVKEVLFDALGHTELEWTKRLGTAVYPLLYHALETQLQAGRSCVVEANFDHDAASERLRRLQERLPFRALQVVCTAPPEELLERYVARTGSRHPGHFDELRVDDVREAIAAGRWRRLELEGETIELDTSQQVDLEGLTEQVRLWMVGAKPARATDQAAWEGGPLQEGGVGEPEVRRPGEP